MSYRETNILIALLFILIWGMECMDYLYAH